MVESQGHSYQIKVIFTELITNQDELEPVAYVIVDEITQQLNLKELQIANECRKKMLSSITHEIRTPLNHSNYLLNQLWENNDLPDSIKENIVKPTLYSNQILESILNDILDLNNLEKREFSMQFQDFNLKDLLTHCLNLIKSQAFNKDIQFSLIYEEIAKQIINNDSKRIQQVVLNLLLNALKFTKKGQIQIKVSQDLVDQNDVVVEVIDTGQGISKKIQQQIFKRFGKSRNILNTQGGGLGLTISYHIAKAISGNQTLCVQSKLNLGSNFFFKVKNYDKIYTGTKSKNYPNSFTEYDSRRGSKQQNNDENEDFSFDLQQQSHFIYSESNQKDHINNNTNLDIINSNKNHFNNHHQNLDNSIYQDFKQTSDFQIDCLSSNRNLCQDFGEMKSVMAKQFNSDNFNNNSQMHINNYNHNYLNGVNCNNSTSQEIHTTLNSPKISQKLIELQIHQNKNQQNQTFQQDANKVNIQDSQLKNCDINKNNSQQQLLQLQKENWQNKNIQQNKQQLQQSQKITQKQSYQSKNSTNQFDIIQEKQKEEDISSQTNCQNNMALNFTNMFKFKDEAKKKLSDNQQLQKSLNVDYGNQLESSTDQLSIQLEEEFNLDVQIFHSEPNYLPDSERSLANNILKYDFIKSENHQIKPKLLNQQGIISQNKENNINQKNQTNYIKIMNPIPSKPNLKFQSPNYQNVSQNKFYGLNSQNPQNITKQIPENHEISLNTNIIQNNLNLSPQNSPNKNNFSQISMTNINHINSINNFNNSSNNINNNNQNIYQSISASIVQQYKSHNLNQKQINTNYKTLKPIKSISVTNSKQIINSCECAKILVIDDTGFNLEVMRAFLIKQFGIQNVDIAISGQDGIEKIEKKYEQYVKLKNRQNIVSLKQFPTLRGIKKEKTLKMDEEEEFDNKDSSFSPSHNQPIDESQNEIKYQSKSSIPINDNSFIDDQNEKAQNPQRGLNQYSENSEKEDSFMERHDKVDNLASQQHQRHKKSLNLLIQSQKVIDQMQNKQQNSFNNIYMNSNSETDYEKYYDKTNNNNLCHECKGIYALILMDIDMPGMDGYETTRKVIQFFQKHKIQKEDQSFICACTCYDDNDTKILVKKCGMKGHIKKPITKKNVQMLLENLKLI